MQEKSLIKQNILKYIDFKGISKYKFYQESGITRGVIDQNNGMSEENTARFLACYRDVNPAWLITGQGNMLLNNYNEEKESLIFLNEDRPAYIQKKHEGDKKLETQSVPLYNIEAAAGIVTLFNDVNHQHPIDYISIPNLPKCDGAVYVAGDSMYPLLKSGDIIMYKQAMDLSNTLFFWGEMYLIGLDHDGDDLVVVKYIQKSEQGKDYVKLVSQNQHHDPIDLHKSKIRALALVKASIRINSMI